MDENVTLHQSETARQPHARGEHVQQALQQAQANLLRYQELFDFAPNGYLVTDWQGIIQEANHAAAAMLDTSKQFLVGKPLLFFVAGADRQAFATNLHQLRFQPEGRLQWELMLCPPRADPLYTLVTVSAPTEGQPASLRWTLQDITRRRRAEEATRAEKEFANSLIELAEAVILVLDHAGRIVRTNRYVLSLTGYREAELEGRSLIDLVLPEDWPSVRQSIDAIRSGGRNARGVHRLRAKDGRVRTVAWSARSLATGPDRQAWALIVGSDITDLLDAQRRAVQAERLAAIGEMVAGLAHESRNALQRSQACLTMLGFRLQDQPEALDLVARVQKAQDDLHRLFEDVRQYAAPIQPQWSIANLAQVWREAWDDLGPARAGRDAELREEIQVANLRCELSPFHLKQVFRNLLDNALSVIPDPVRITIRCTAATIHGREGLQVAVRDNGPGFAPDQRPKVFEPFVTTKTHGTGLGLAISKRIVEAHGGRIALGEEDGPCAVILITLPRRST